MSFSAERKPHAVFSPFPIQGHINPLFKLAKLLHLRGFHITFVHTEHNHKLLLKSRGLNALEDFFCFESILDGVPPNNDDNLDATHHVVSLFTCLVSDCAMTFTIEAAEELSLPILLFHPASASTLLYGLHFRTLLDKGLIPLKGIHF
ncbi:hypothetical protein JHK82_052414 [Glycine max]|uniref:7-deoxyloganetin glucosyltransferase n=2 Tax=Glycine subgen. Soja TaxID=1462606 RepID=A0A445FC07_GLYSO|nr:hypothetical protein JHK86_052251 [Glycine max]KAG4914773.1 hypothetical protein JHK87_052330 [Glycine soja]KAG4926622.1 hypothetical protein JHK85_053108 [Glycine max]KAG5082254.1 hypothetical protein JHK84_052292 [Glycine max]KAG5085017.1 hypothetical protein JHK82_052414 [Glycine max]